MAAKARIVQERYEVQQALLRRGIRPTWLNETVAVGVNGWNSGRRHGMRGSAGYRLVDDALHYLRTAAIPDGWQDPRFPGWQIPVTYNAQTSVAIGVTRGDKNTGVFGDDDPRTVSFKGPETKRKTDAAAAERLFDPDQHLDAIELFYLLIHPGEDGRATAELSRPLTVKDGQISTWSIRYLLEPFEPQWGSSKVVDLSNGPSGPQIEIAVRSKLTG